MSNSLWPHGLQHTRLLCLSLSPGVCSNSCPLSQWYHPAISFSVIPFSFCLQSFQHQGLFQWVSSLHEVAKVLESQPQHSPSSEYSGWVSLLYPGSPAPLGLPLAEASAAAVPRMQHLRKDLSVFNFRQIFFCYDFWIFLAIYVHSYASCEPLICVSDLYYLVSISFCSYLIFFCFFFFLVFIQLFFYVSV